MEALLTVLIPLLIQVESGGDNSAIGDKGAAIGCLQIHRACWQDGTEALGVDWPYKDAHNRSKAIKVCRAYLTRYCTKKRLGRTPTLEDMARCWNGGPNGYKKKATEKYWKKVQKELERSKK